MAYNSEYPYSNDITQVAEPVGTGPESPYRVTTVQNIVPSFVDELPDYSQDVAELATNKNLLWCSMDKPADFKKNGKVNFLHLSDDGVFTLTVIKPGTKKTYTATIPQDVVSIVRKNLIELQKTGWDKRFSKESWNDERGDVDGNTYSFKRFINIAPGFDLYWEGEHTNQGVKVVVNDKLYLVPLPGVST